MKKLLIIFLLSLTFDMEAQEEAGISGPTDQSSIQTKNEQEKTKSIKDNRKEEEQEREEAEDETFYDPGNGNTTNTKIIDRLPLPSP